MGVWYNPRQLPPPPEMRRQSPNTVGFHQHLRHIRLQQPGNGVALKSRRIRRRVRQFPTGRRARCQCYPSTVGIRRPYWGFFVQDDIKVSARLTVNIGLRYEIEQGPYDAANRYSIIDISCLQIL